MVFTNSKLVSYTHISPNRTVNRNQPITKITIHHMAGVCSLEQFDNIVKNPARQMSSNYAIGSDGRIGLFCEEKDRSWCSSSPWNDHRSVTIEVSNSAYGDASGWPISDKVYGKLIDLCVDICQRNGIEKLECTGDKNGSLTLHSYFSFTCCPGPWIKAHIQDICNKVNARLGNSAAPEPAKKPNNQTNISFKVGDLVSINKGSTWYNGGSIPSWVSDEQWYISSISGDRAVLGLNKDKNRNIQSPIKTNNIKLIASNSKTYTISLSGNSMIYDDSLKPKQSLGNDGKFTIVEEKTVNGVTYGKLKSGVGWVIVKNDNVIRKGDRVKVLKNVCYGTNKTFKTYVSTYYVLEVSGSRAVISSDGKNVTAAVAVENLQKV